MTNFPIPHPSKINSQSPGVTFVVQLSVWIINIVTAQDAAPQAGVTQTQY